MICHIVGICKNQHIIVRDVCAAGIFGGLLIGFELGQNVERCIAVHMEEIIGGIVPGLGMIRFSTEGS